MLTVTDEAIVVIRALMTGESGERVGLRIANEDGDALTVSMVSAPDEGDEVVEDSGARLYVAPEAADLLDNKALVVSTEPDGMVQFGLSDLIG
jgi:Fe-S cluster assembly iron-binding protein IscA